MAEESEKGNMPGCININLKTSPAANKSFQGISGEKGKRGSSGGTSHSIHRGTERECIVKENVSEHAAGSVGKRRRDNEDDITTYFLEKEINGCETAKCVQQKTEGEYKKGNPYDVTRRGRGFEGNSYKGVLCGVNFMLRPCGEYDTSSKSILHAARQISGGVKPPQDVDTYRPKDLQCTNPKERSTIGDEGCTERTQDECIQRNTYDKNQENSAGYEMGPAQHAKRRSCTACPGENSVRAHSPSDAAYNRPGITSLCRSSGSHRKGDSMIFWPELANVISEEYDERNRMILKWVNIERRVEDSEWRTGTWEQPRAHVLETPQLPLYAPIMLPLNIAKILSWSSSSCDDVKLFSWLSDAGLYRELLRETPRCERQPYQNDHMKPHVKQLLESNILRTFDTQKVKAWCRMFPLPEPKKNRCRLIIDTRQVNDVMRRRLFELGLQTNFASLDAIRQLVYCSSASLEADYKCFYYQVPLEVEVQPYFGVMINGECFVVTRLPMGFCGAVAIANRISKVVAHETRSRSAGTEEDIVQVDNTYYFGGRERLEVVKICMETVCVEAQITVGSISIFEHGIILGVLYNMTKKTMQLSEKYIVKHRNLLKKFFDVNDAPLLIVWRVVAVLLRAMMVLNKRLCYFFFVLKMVRRLAAQIAHGQLSWKTFIKIEDQREWRQLNEMYKIFLQNPECCILPSQGVSNQYVFSDASDVGLGVVFVKDNTVIVHSRVWSQEEQQMHIGEREALALQGAINLCPTVRFSAPVFFVDATVLFAAAKRSLSRNFIINKVISRLKSRYPTAPVHWIPSGENLADAPSRNRQLILPATGTVCDRQTPSVQVSHDGNE